MHEKHQRIVRAKAALLVVDIQERLWPAMFEKERLLRNALILIKGAAALRVPSLATEQYRKGLGPTVPAIAEAIPDFAPREKLAFSAAGEPGVVEALRGMGCREVVICGIEAHVCVCQTCLDFLAEGFKPFVVADAVSSRAPENCRVALDRMRAAGATIVSTEMILFELLGRAGTEEFRQVLELVR